MGQQIKKTSDNIEQAKPAAVQPSSNGNGTADADQSRLKVLKTYKIYVGGQFPRTESGRYYVAENASGEKLANVCLSSRKDFRDAVSTARAAAAVRTGRP